MPDLTSLLGFALVALGMVLTPGPDESPNDFGKNH